MAETLELRCRRCGADIPAEDVNIERLVAKCPSCNAVFGFGDRFGAPGQAVQKRAEVSLPARFTREDTGHTLTITKRWLSPSYYFLAAFTTFWDGFMVFWFYTAFSQGERMMAAFGTLHGVIGLGLLYVTVAGFVNVTRLEVGRDGLTIQHGPVPWPGNLTIDTSTLDQLYCKERVRRGNNGYRYTYELHAIDRRDGDLKLAAGFDEPDQVLFIEQEVERFLDIENRPVRDEWHAPA